MGIAVEALLLFVIIAFNFLIGLFVLLKQPGNRVHRAFFTVALGTSLWGTGLLLIEQTNSFQVFDKVTIYGWMILLFGFVMFARVFPNRHAARPRFYLVFLPLAVLAALTPFNLIIRNAVVLANGVVMPTNGPLFPFFAIASVGYIVLGLVMLARTYRRSAGLARLQMQYLLSGLGMFVICAMLFDVVLPLFNIFSLNFLGPASSIVLTLAIAYAIVRHELMDIRVVIQRGLVYTIVLAIVIACYVAGLGISAYFLHVVASTSAIISAGITTTVGVFFLRPLETYFRKKTDHIFFKDAYDYGAALHTLSGVLHRSLNREDIVTQSEQNLREIFRTDSASIILDPLSEGSVTEKDQTAGFATIAQPIMFEGNSVGLVRLGKKLSGDLYTAQDKQLLSTFAFQAAIALGKADLHAQVREYNEHLEALVDRRTVEVKRMQEDQRQTMIDISHNLQTPLAIIRGELEMLSETPGVDARVDTVRNTNDRVSGFIRQLLHLARLEHSIYAVEQKPLDLSALMREQVEYFEVMAEQEGVRIETAIEKGCRILGDRRLLGELFVNLVTNAMTYRDKESARQPLIRISLRKEGDLVRATVADNGIGIPEKDLPEIFLRFYRVPNPEHKLQGTGLGLAIVKNIVERHKGSIEVASTLGEGTAFTLRFPAVE